MPHFRIFYGFDTIQGFSIWGFSLNRFSYAIFTYSQEILNIQLVIVRQFLSSSSTNSISYSEASTIYTDYTQPVTNAQEIKWLLFVLKQKADKQHKM